MFRRKPTLIQRLRAIAPAVLALAIALTFPAFSVRDGNGGYSLPANGFSNPVTGGTLVASEATAVWSDITTAIAGSLATDGQSTMSGNIKMGNNKLVNLTTGSARTDSLSLGQAQDGAFRWGGVAGGTADVLTLSLTPTITAYVDGLTIYFVSSASPNTGAATVNVNSVATDAILKNGSALAAGDIAASKVYAITYYNSDWHLWSPIADYAQKSVSNTFTAAQSISITAAGAALTATSTDAGASAGPNIVSDRNSATPANNDSIGAMLFRGRDSGGNSTDYTYLQGVILDTTNGSEDGTLQIRSSVAGADTAVAQFSDGQILGAPTGSYKGAGTLNAAAGLYVNGHGTVAQFVEAETSTYTTAATILPVDNTIPQNTEGDEILTVAITPTNASSTLIIEVDVQASESGVSGLYWACAVFVDTTANAIAARAGTIETSNFYDSIYFKHTLSAGSTSARTYKLRCGSGSATDLKINGDGTTGVFNGVQTSSITVTEVLPQ